MKRRSFLAAAGCAGLTPLLHGRGVEAADHPDGKQYYQLILYRLASGDKQQALYAFLRQAAIPALGRLEIGPVGVFTMLDGSSADVYVLLPHPSLQSVAIMIQRLGSDEEFLQAGAAFLNAPKSNPAYLRMESSLMIAFDGAPRLEIPTRKQTRIFQLRTYESHSVERGQKKIEMFNQGGELEIFRRVGMPPVFFGETLVGARMPNLTYMLGFDDQQALEKGWAAFHSDPAWLRLKDLPEYQDTVSNITNTLLRPAACSQI